VAALGVRAVQNGILRRAQPLAEPDVIAADDAIRSRSLHVLAGGGGALVILCVTAQFGAAHVIGEVHPMLDFVRAVGIGAAGACGWLVATGLHPPRRDAGPAMPDTDRPLAGAT
jgi:hypothetical protein